MTKDKHAEEAIDAAYNMKFNKEDETWAESNAEEKTDMLMKSPFPTTEPVNSYGKYPQFPFLDEPGIIGQYNPEALEGMSNDPEPLTLTSEVIRKRIKTAGDRYWANDNISHHFQEGDKEKLIQELKGRFESVLDSLLIDRETDPNSEDTPHRLAKMYINEIMGGRYSPKPKVTAFPNTSEDRYGGMIVVRAELKSMCSHHHQPVAAVAYIGILPSTKIIGLSKYARLAQHCARRGTLQEELTKQIADEIVTATGSKDVAVYVQGTHGCMENRGVCAHSSLTQTTELRGQFYNQSVKQEFLDYIKMQQQFAGNRT